MALKVGYKASAEQFGPRDLVEYAVLAIQRLGQVHAERGVLADAACELPCLLHGRLLHTRVRVGEVGGSQELAKHRGVEALRVQPVHEMGQHPALNRGPEVRRPRRRDRL